MGGEVDGLGSGFLNGEFGAYNYVGLGFWAL